jgi:hypothetical protein
MPSMKNQNVKHVTSNVTNVLRIHTQDVPFVLQPELPILNQTAHAQMDPTNWPIKLVENVLTNVKPVLELPITVLIVLSTE